MNLVIPDPETIGGYDVQKDPWFSPQHVIIQFKRLGEMYGENVDLKREFQQAREMFVGAMALLGAFELSEENKYWLQANRQSESPDVVAVKQTQRPNLPILLEISQLEVVELNDRSPLNDVVEFLKKTKLSPKKSYGDKVMILCIVNKQIPINRVEIAEKIKELKPKPTIYILGKVEGEGYKFVIFSPHPNPTKHVIYEVADTMKKYQLPSPTRFHRGTAQNISFDKAHIEVTTMYDMFNLNEAKLEKYRV